MTVWLYRSSIREDVVVEIAGSGASVRNHKSAEEDPYYYQMPTHQNFRLSWRQLYTVTYVGNGERRWCHGI